jgi:hypothetical protein
VSIVSGDVLVIRGIQSEHPQGGPGGGGALVAMRCVPLAIGGDVAGSIRIPAAFCGVIGFKPTLNRLSQKGCMSPRKLHVELETKKSEVAPFVAFFLIPLVFVL